MLQKRTVFVLGAGSSVEFELPAGDGLAKSISARTDFGFDGAGYQTKGDVELYRALKNRFPTGNVVFEAGRRISEGLPIARSIDDYLYNHGHDDVLVTTGKAAIAQSILESESSSNLVQFHSHEAQIQYQALPSHAETWIYKMFSFLQTGVRLGELDRIFDGLSIINFNYDRCVEVFLYHALQRAYGVDRDAAAGVMSTLDITHPYGQVGKLPWQCAAIGRGIEFGERLHGEALLNVSDEIKTFTEQAHDEAEKQHWQKLIQECEQLVFLGFGFHRQNVELLSLSSGPTNTPEIYATTYKTSGADQDVFRKRLYKLTANPEPDFMYSGNLQIEFANNPCVEMIGAYGLKILS